MKPAPYNLPPIYRGCIYPAISFTWLDINGQPVDLTSWVGSVASQNIIFPISTPDPTSGQNSISLNVLQTQNLALGVEAWDFRWSYLTLAYPPALAGFVEIKEPQSGAAPPALTGVDVQPLNGIYISPLTVTLTALDQVQGVNLIYTTDGTDPTIANGTRITSSSGTVVLPNPGSATFKAIEVFNTLVSPITTRNYTLR